MKFCSYACGLVNDELQEWGIECLKNNDLEKSKRIHRVLVRRSKRFGT